NPAPTGGKRPQGNFAGLIRLGFLVPLLFKDKSATATFCRLMPALIGGVLALVSYFRLFRFRDLWIIWIRIAAIIKAASDSIFDTSGTSGSNKRLIPRK